MLPYAKIQGGTLTATAGTGQTIQISSMSPPSYFFMKNITQWGSAVAKDIEFWWEQSMALGTANGIHQAVTTGALNSFTLTSAGITPYSTATPPTFATNSTVTAVTKGSAGGVTVVTLTNDGATAHGPAIVVGDFVRLTNVVGMQQISGYVFQVVATTSTTSITIDLDSSGFAASGTTAVLQKVIPSQYYPRAQRITNISQAVNCVVSLTMDTNFTIGERVSFRVPSSSSSFTTMSQINNVFGVVTAVTNATATTCSTVTVAINTTGFTPFALPTSAQTLAYVGQQPISFLVPAGSGVVPNQNPPGTNLLDTFDNLNKYVIQLGNSIFTNSSTGDVWMWQAIMYDEYQNM
jgi:hypothetical protein